jgi:hypothetical protein
MDFLQSVEKDLADKKYGEPIHKLSRMYADIKSFQKSRKLSDKTIKYLSEDEIINIKEISQQQAYNDEIEAILEQTLENLDEFTERIVPYIKEFEKLIKFTIVNDKSFSKDRGYVVIRNNVSEKMKIYSWQFSIIKVDENDQIGLLLSELLDPLPEYTKSNKDISQFFEKEIKNFSKYSDCLIITDLLKTKNSEELSFDVIKEKSIDYIVENYKKYLSDF